MCQTSVGIDSPCRGSQQHLPIVAAAVDEDVAGGAVRARAAEALRRVALLQRALVLLHGQAVVGQAQLFVSRLGVQFERLALWAEDQKEVAGETGWGWGWGDWAVVKFNQHP